MTFKEFYENQRKKQEEQRKEDEPLKQAIRQYVGNDYEELLDFFVNFDRKRLKSYFKLDKSINFYDSKNFHGGQNNDKRANG